MNFQKYGYTKWNTEQFDQYFTANRNKSFTKKYRIAQKRGWVSRQDADDDLNSHRGGYNRRAYVLPSHITSYVSSSDGLIDLKSNMEQMFHHRVLGLPTLSPFRDFTDNINILEFYVDFNLEMIHTQTILKDIEMYFVICPDPYPAIVSRLEDQEGPKVDKDGNVIKEPHPDYPLGTKEKVYNNANLELLRMMERNFDRDQMDIEPFKGGVQLCAERYAIVIKSFKQIKSTFDGKFHTNFKFKSSPKSGDINLRKGEALFVIVKCYCTTSIEPPKIYTLSNITFRYSLN